MKRFLPLLMLFAIGFSSAQQAPLSVEPLYEIAFPEGHTSASVYWSPDHRYVALGFDVYDGVRPQQVLTRIYDGVSAELVYEAPEFGGWYEDGTRVLVGDAESAWVFNLGARAVEFTLPQAVEKSTVSQFRKSINGFGVSDPGLRTAQERIGAEIMFREDSYNLAVYDAASGEQVAALPDLLHIPYILPGGHRVVVGREAGIEIYDRGPWTLIAELPGYSVPTGGGSWASADGLSILAYPTKTSIGQFAVWKIGEHLSPLFVAETSPFWLSADGLQYAATAYRDLYVYDTATGDRIDMLDLPADSDLRISAIDGDFVYLDRSVVPNSSVDIVIWDRAAREFVKTIHAIVGFGFTHVDPAADLIIDTEYTDEPSYKVLRYTDDSVIFERTGLADDPVFSPDYGAALMYVLQPDGQPTAFFLDRLASGETVTVETGWMGGDLRFDWSPDGQRFAAASSSAVRFYALGQ